jgi:hypothetical protein
VTGANHEAPVDKDRSTNAKAMAIARLVFTFATGFFLQLNIWTSNFGPNGTRVSDIFVLVGVGLTGWQLVRGAHLRPLLLLLGICAVGLLLRATLGNMSSSFYDPSDLLIEVRYGLSYLGGFAFALMFQEDELALEAFCLGILAGGLAAVPIFYLQVVGKEDLLMKFGLQAKDAAFQVTTYAGALTRKPGIWQHANEAGNVMALLAAPAAWFTLRRRRYWPLGIAVVALLGSFYFTLNRAGLINFAIVTMLSFLLSPNLKLSGWRMPVVALGGVVVIAAFIITSSFAFTGITDPAVTSRVTQTQQVSANAEGRLTTTLDGAMIALQHPWGLNYNDKIELLYQDTGFRTPHDGYLSVEYAVGSVFLILTVYSIVSAIGSAFQSTVSSVDIFYFFLALSISIAFFYEELGYNCTYIFLLGILCASRFGSARAPFRPGFAQRRRSKRSSTRSKVVET